MDRRTAKAIIVLTIFVGSIGCTTHSRASAPSIPPGPTFTATASPRPSAAQSESRVSPPPSAATSPGAAGSLSATGSPSPASTPSAASTSVPIVYCPTSVGYDPQPTQPTEPTTATVTIPAAIAADVALYQDYTSRFRLLAPKGWRCSALIGADGSSTLGVVAPGNAAPTWQRAPAPFHRSDVAGVFMQYASACSDCIYGQACPVLDDPADAATYGACHESVSPEERVSWLDNNGRPSTRSNAVVAQFVDPPGVAGDGAPSGGTNTAVGRVVLANDSAYTYTCTLPMTFQAICAAATDVRSTGREGALVAY